MAIFSPHASPRGPRTGKSPVRGKIRAPCIRNELALARYARHASEKPRKQPFGNTPREDPARKGHFSLHRPLESCTARRSCHPPPNSASARDPGTAEQCEPPELDRPAQETQPGRQRPRRFLGSKYRQQLPRRRHRPADSPSCARPKGGLPSLLVAPVFCALGRCDRFVNARQSPFYAIISLWLRKNRHPSGKTQALPIQWVGCSRGHVPYRTINKEKRLRWQLLHIALSARKRRKW